MDLPNNIKWIDARENKPPRPERPYHVYLVWVVQAYPNATGTEMLLQFDRDANDWLTLPPGRTGARQVVTHYSEVLDVLGAPGPQPYGPRGDYNL